MTQKIEEFTQRPKRVKTWSDIETDIYVQKELLFDEIVQDGSFVLTETGYREYGYYYTNDHMSNNEMIWNYRQTMYIYTKKPIEYTNPQTGISIIMQPTLLRIDFTTDIPNRIASKNSSRKDAKWRNNPSRKVRLQGISSARGIAMNTATRTINTDYAYFTESDCVDTHNPETQLNRRPTLYSPSYKEVALFAVNLLLFHASNCDGYDGQPMSVDSAARKYGFFGIEFIGAEVAYPNWADEYWEMNDAEDDEYPEYYEDEDDVDD